MFCRPCRFLSMGDTQYFPSFVVKLYGGLCGRFSPQAVNSLGIPPYHAHQVHFSTFNFQFL